MKGSSDLPYLFKVVKNDNTSTSLPIEPSSVAGEVANFAFYSFQLLYFL